MLNQSFFQSVKIDNYGRRTWDTNEYERKARDRIEESQKEVAKKKAQPYDLYKAKEDKEEGLVSSDSDDDAFEDWDFSERRERKSKKNKDEPPVKRSLLQKRDYKVDLDSKLGKSVVVNKNAPSTSGGGYYCNACDCVVKDSINFLDHINGKKHQRNLGMSMKVERSSLDQVKNRFAQLKKKSEEKEKEYNLSQKVTDMQEEVRKKISPF